MSSIALDIFSDSSRSCFSLGCQISNDQVVRCNKSIVLPNLNKMNSFSNQIVVLCLIANDHWVTECEVRANFSVKWTTIQSIVHIHLSINILCWSWTKNNYQQQRISCCKSKGILKIIYNIIATNQLWILLLWRSTCNCYSARIMRLGYIRVYIQIGIISEKCPWMKIAF